MNARADPDDDVVQQVLAGQLSYDDVHDRAQAAVRTAWRAQIEHAIASLDLRSRFIAEGRRRWSESDARGQVVVHYSPDAGGSGTDT